MYEMSSLIHVSAWERVSLWRRLLCAFGRVTMLFLVVIVLGFVIYAKRYQIAAKIWHWKYGYVSKMDNYDVPIPEGWYLDQNRTDFTLINTARSSPSRDGNLHSTFFVRVHPGRHPIGAREMEFWRSIERQRLDRGLTTVLDNTLRFDDEDMICIGGGGTRVVSLNCASAQGLSIMFIGAGADLETFYTWVSQIRKHQ